MTYTANQQKNRQIVIDALKSQNVKAFLDLIGYTEGTDIAHGYYTLYGSGKFNSLSKHPNIVVKAGKFSSTAAGRYQILNRTWLPTANSLGLTDFSKLSQDMSAVYLIYKRGALNLLINGKFLEALFKCAPEWASFPKDKTGVSYYPPQKAKSVTKCQEFYKSRGGKGFFFYSPIPTPVMNRQDQQTTFFQFLQSLVGTSQKNS